MKLERFIGKKLKKSELTNASSIYGGETNCGTAATSSMGWDKDTDGADGATDTDKEIENSFQHEQ